MKAKKKLLYVAGGLALPVIFCAVLIQVWRVTPYGKLHPVAAVFLKLTGDKDRSGDPLEVTRRSRAELTSLAKLVSRSGIRPACITGLTIPGRGGPIPVRIYTPKGDGPFPAVIYCHGGGWAEGSIDSHDGLTRTLCVKTGAVVVSVDYRLAPEHPFPAAVDDAYAALLWVREHAAKYRIDGRKIALAGDSAGGNLAAAVCLMARDRRGPVIAFQALIYPGVDTLNLNTGSYRKFGSGYMLTKRDIEFFIKMYLPDPRDRKNPYASPLLAANHRNLPPALIITAEFDVLRDEGEAYAKKLSSAGVEARARRYQGMIHGFISADRLVSQAGAAVDEIAAALRAAFARIR